MPAPRLAPPETSRRWAALLRQIFEVDPLGCPACHGTMRIVAFITRASVIDRILTHLRTRAATRSSVLARSAIGRYTRPTPIEIPIPDDGEFAQLRSFVRS